MTVPPAGSVTVAEVNGITAAGSGRDRAGAAAAGVAMASTAAPLATAATTVRTLADLRLSEWVGIFIRGL
ncbi:hypothetical protein GCM10023322_09440 [Rugosimonospora acidiphila]|uniref:Uncharacterized protein n=1 Tax=Rugosimonospora acidiphila TaxID=556531 RepID=A0ABP9RKC1_9ACTN